MPAANQLVQEQVYAKTKPPNHVKTGAAAGGSGEHNVHEVGLGGSMLMLGRKLLDTSRQVINLRLQPLVSRLQSFALRDIEEHAQ